MFIEALKPQTPLGRSKSSSYWLQIRSSTKRLAHAVISETSTLFPADARPHATVSFGGVHLVGLLDSGASISCLGKNAEQRLQQLSLPIKRVKQSVQTADGAEQAVIGYVDVDITFNATVKPIRLFVIPSLSQELYLGIDFWKEFKLAPAVIGEVSTEPDVPTKKEDVKLHQLTEEQFGELEAVKAEFLSCEKVGLGKTPLLKHRIDVGHTTPIKQRHHFVSPAIQSVLNAEVDSMLERGIIEESQSAWSSPVLVVRKSDGRMRFCLDCRAVNKVTTKDAYPMPIIDGILASLHETVYISSLDLKDAFWQIELDQESRDKTAFTVPGRPLYQFARMPFGLCNAPQTMCRLMDKVIPTELREFVFVYMDDLLVVSKCFETHLTRLKAVAKRLRDANLTINVRKSHFCMREIRYLGHIVGNGCIKPDPGKVDAITNLPAPRTIRQVRSFLGMSGWYQRYIAGYAGIAAPITDLLGKHPRFVWTEAAQVAFEELKDRLTSAPLLSHPDFSKPFVIQCDASKTGVGGVLYQLDDDGNEHPIAFMSRKLNSAQRNYSVTEQECLAAILSLKKFRGYVEGMTFKIVTDHASLKWLMTQKDLSGRLARWSIKLQGFDFTIEHRRGKDNVVPDALSRVHMDELRAQLDRNPGVAFGGLDDAAFEEPDYVAIRTRAETDSERLPDIQVRDQRIYVRTRHCRDETLEGHKDWKLWVPSSLTESVINTAHSPPLASHSGTGKTIEKLQRTYYWPKMAEQVRVFVRQCATCKETKAPNVTLRPPMGQQVSVDRPWQRLYIDLLGPYPRSKAGNTTLLIILDKFSKFVLLKPLRKATAGEITRYLEREVFHVFGVPETIWSDNGVQFVSKEFRGLLRQYGTSQVTTASHSPQSNASERVNRSILAAIRAYVGKDQQSWDEEISSIGSSLRNNVHDATGFSPHYLVFGQHFVSHGSCHRLLRELTALPTGDLEVLAPPDTRQIVGEKVRRNLQAAYERHQRTYNTRCREVSFTEGQEVYRRNFQPSNFAQGHNAKLGKQWLKSRVLKRVGTAMYELADMDGKRLRVLYHAKDLKQ